MPAIIETALVTAPYIVGGGITGAALGVLAESKVQNSIASKQQRWSEANGEVAEAVTAQTEPLRQRLGRLAGPLAVTLAIAGSIAGYAVAPGASADSEKREVHGLVDRSGLTDLSSEGSEKTPADTIDTVVAAFAKKEDVKFSAQVTQSSTIFPSDAAGVLKIDALGGANMKEAFTTANREIALDNQNTTTGQPANAMVVLTGRNNIGKADEVIEEANNTNTQVFVVTTDEKITNDAEASLKKVAEGTGGKIWASNGSNADEIAETVSEAVSNQAAPEKGTKWGAIMAAIGTVAYAGYLLPHRRNMLINRNGSPIARRSKNTTKEGEL